MTAPIDTKAARARCDAATPGPWETGMTPDLTLDQQAEHMARHLQHGEVCRIHMVWAPSHPLTVIGADRTHPDHAVTPCTTGNGPTSEANADFIAHARTDLPAALDEVERLRKALAEVDSLVELHCDDAVGAAVEIHAIIAKALKQGGA